MAWIRDWLNECLTEEWTPDSASAHLSHPRPSALPRLPDDAASEHHNQVTLLLNRIIPPPNPYRIDRLVHSLEHKLLPHGRLRRDGDFIRVFESGEPVGVARLVNGEQGAGLAKVDQAQLGVGAALEAEGDAVISDRLLWACSVPAMVWMKWAIASAGRTVAGCVPARLSDAVFPELGPTRRSRGLPSLS